MNNDNLWNKIKEFGQTHGVVLQPVEAEALIFEENVRLNCFYCGRYGNNWRCPPKIPDLNYKKIVSEFDNIVFVYNRYKITPENENQIRFESTNHIHKSLLAMEKILFDNGISTALSFIGGSCKLCKNGCGPTNCNNPYIARMPVEATGMNIQKSAAKYGIEITWPITDSILRLGMLIW